MEIPRNINTKDDDVEMKDCDDTFIKVEGIMIKQDFDSSIMSPNDVSKYTPLQTLTLKQTMHVPFEHDIQVLAYFMYEYYSDVTSEFPSKMGEPQPDVIFSVQQ